MPEKRLQIIYHFRVRGTGAEGVHIAGIVNGFRSFGHLVRLVSPTGIDPTAQNSEKASVQPIKKSLLKSILHPLADSLPQPCFEIMELFYNFFAIIKLFKEILKVRPDFIYERYAFFNFSGAFIANLFRLPFVVEVNEISGHKRVRGQTFIFLAKLIEKYIFQHANLVITVSDFLNKEVSQISGPKPKIVTMPNGVPKTWFENRPSEEVISDLRLRLRLEGKKVICFIGGLVPWHNFDMLLNVVLSLQSEIPEASLLIVGEGPQRNFIEEQVKLFPFKNDSVVLTGNVPHRDIPAYISLSDVAIIPETNSFRSPIKMFEYMAMGKAVVAPRMPAIQAVIEDGIDGLLFKQQDDKSCRGTLVKLFNDKAYALKMGEAAFQKIVEKYTWEKHAEEILSLIDIHN